MTLPRTRPSLLLAASAVAYMVLQSWFFPTAIAIKDESYYLAMAYTFRAGTVFADIAHITLFAGVNNHSHFASIYPPGEGILLLAATWLPWRSAFVITLVVHLLGAVGFERLLRRFGLRGEWAILYLFFPPLLLFSRTVMTEVPAAALTVAVLLAYTTQKPRGKLLAGALLGASVCFRYADIFLVLAMVGCLGVRWAAKGRPGGVDAALLVAGLVPPLAALAAFNLVSYGSVTPTFYAQTATFGLREVPGHLLFYIFDLVLVYPLMLLAFVLYRGPWRLEILAVGVVIVLAMSSYGYIDNSHGLGEDLVVGARLVLGAAPVFLLAYAAALDRLVSTRASFVKWAPAATLVALVGVAVPLVSRHQERLNQSAAVRELIFTQAPRDAVLFVNLETIKFLNPAWDNRPFLDYKVARHHVRVFPGYSKAAVIFTSPGDSGPLVDGPATERTAAAVGARRIVDESIGWRVLIYYNAEGDPGRAVP